MNTLAVWTRWPPLGLFALGLAARLAILSTDPFDGLYGQDAFAYAKCIREISSLQSIEIPCIDFYWPLGYPALAALLTTITARGAQLASMLAGAAVAPLTYWMVLTADLAADLAADRNADSNANANANANAEMTRQRTHAALAAGTITAVCGQLVLSSLVVMSDAAGLFWATLAAALLLAWQRAPTARALWVLLPGAATALALAIATRWIYLTLLLPFGVFFLGAGYTAYRRGAAARPAQLASAALAGLCFAAIMAVQLRQNMSSPAPFTHHGWIVNWNVSGALISNFDNPDGHFRYRAPPLLFYASTLFHPLYVTPLLGAFALWGAWHSRRSPSLVLLGGWALTIYLYLIGIPYENGRFALAYMPPVAALIGIGLFGQGRPPWDGLRCRWMLLAVSSLVTLGFTYRSYGAFRADVSRQSSAIRYLEAHVPPHSTILTFGLSIALEHYTDFNVIDLFQQSGATLLPRICRPDVYVYVDRDNLDSQWAERAPQRAVHWVDDGIGDRLVGSDGPWMLYRVNACTPGTSTSGAGAPAR